MLSRQSFFKLDRGFIDSRSQTGGSNILCCLNTNAVGRLHLPLLPLLINFFLGLADMLSATTCCVKFIAAILRSPIPERSRLQNFWCRHERRQPLIIQLSRATYIPVFCCLRSSEQRSLCSLLIFDVFGALGTVEVELEWQVGT